MKKLIIAALCLVILGPTAGATPPETPTVYSDKPQLPPKTMKLEEIWRVGGEEGDLIFGMMIDSVEDADGNIYLLDAQLGQVEIISPEGEHLRTISGRGEGPGEVQMPQNLIMLPNRSIGILEAFPAHFVTLAPDGTPGGSIMIGGESGPGTGFNAAFYADCRTGSILIGGQHSTQTDVGQQRTQYMAMISDSGEELMRYREAHMVLDFSQPSFVERDLLPTFMLANALDDMGRAYTPLNREDYAIEVYATDGSLEHVIKRKFQPRKRNDKEMQRLNSLIDAWMQGFPGDMVRDLETIEPTIADMQVDDRNMLWVQHSRSGMDQPSGVLMTYDTFSPDGRWMQEVSVRAEGDPTYDGIRFLGGDRVLLIKGYVLARWASRGAQNADFGEEEAEAMEVIYCRMVDE